MSLQRRAQLVRCPTRLHWHHRAAARRLGGQAEGRLAL